MGKGPKPCDFWMLSEKQKGTLFGVWEQPLRVDGGKMMNKLSSPGDPHPQTVELKGDEPHAH